MIRIKNLKKSFGSQLVLDNVSLDIEQGSTIGIVGPSGTGKSVLLKIITGLLPADSGDVLIDGDSMVKDCSEADQRQICEKMGVLFQGAALFDSLTLFENVAFALRERKTCSEEEITDRTLLCLEQVGLEGHELSYPGEVSIGMRKRVGIARALVTQPQVLLFDEPNTGLDPLVGQEIYDLIKSTQKEFGFTGIVVSHEIPEVFQVCRTVAMLYQGRIQAHGTVEEFLSSENPIVQQFINGSVQGPIEIA